MSTGTVSVAGPEFAASSVFAAFTASSAIAEVPAPAVASEGRTKFIELNAAASSVAVDAIVGFLGKFSGASVKEAGPVVTVS